MNRRQLVQGMASLGTGSMLMPAMAHHGWSSFDQDRPIYLQGRVTRVQWRNPHAELVIEVPANLALPADLAQRALPAQSAPVDGKALLAKTVLPTRKDRSWEVELAPLTRMEAWKVAPIAVGAQVSLVGFTFAQEKGDAIVRVEYLFVGDRAYGLRSSPA
ncbi:DUF6152 family protein [Variovorax sp. VNK109]|uniref:DUF6152 family protein n=1 Tax=Variovorax sp. VNK109 TaxID=3400919 RepID=UPI003BFB66FB